jgi:hypothetical protein
MRVLNAVLKLFLARVWSSVCVLQAPAVAPSPGKKARVAPKAESEAEEEEEAEEPADGARPVPLVLGSYCRSLVCPLLSHLSLSRSSFSVSVLARLSIS